VARIVDCQRKIKEMEQKQQSPAINVNTEVEANAQTITSRGVHRIGLDIYNPTIG
jgi:hypothetical protein